MNTPADILSNVCEEYFSIGETHQQERIRFYERNIKQSGLPVTEELIYVQIDYCFALFKVSAYKNYLEEVDSLLGLVVKENIYNYGGYDVYKTLLFYKALSFYHSIEYKKAIYVITELIKIEGETKIYSNAYLKIVVDSLRYKSHKLRAAVLVLFLCSAGVIAIEILVVRSFYHDWIIIFEALRNGLALSGLLLLLASEIYFRAKAKKNLKRDKR